MLLFLFFYKFTNFLFFFYVFFLHLYIFFLPLISYLFFHFKNYIYINNFPILHLSIIIVILVIIIIKVKTITVFILCFLFLLVCFASNSFLPPSLTVIYINIFLSFFISYFSNRHHLSLSHITGLILIPPIQPHTYSTKHNPSSLGYFYFDPHY